MHDKVIYLAGPYRASTIYGTLCNIRKAEMVAVEFWRRGVVVLSPHKNTALLDGAAGIQDQTWLDGALELMRRCDAVVLLPGWETSSGSQDERFQALAHGQPVFELCWGVTDGVVTASEMGRQVDQIIERLDKLPERPSLPDEWTVDRARRMQAVVDLLGRQWDATRSKPISDEDWATLSSEIEELQSVASEGS